jgi:beta-phosphoglucomutase-like phosphatase (HAD superfamily)
MAVEAVVFDFDGLMMDTEGTMLASWQHEWRWHGLELDTSTFFAEHAGDVSEHRYAALAAAVGPAYDQAASHARRLARRDELNAALDLLPGITDWGGRGPGGRAALRRHSQLAR